MGFLDRLKGALPGKTQREEDGPSWIAEAEWRSWDPPLNIVSGESHYQSALQRVAGRPREQGWLVACEAELRREPDNPYDGDAIAVLIAGEKVGYIAGDACGDLAEAMDRFGTNATAKGIPALVRGGSLNRRFLGVVLWLNHEDVRRSLPGVPWKDLVEEFLCEPWPPRQSGRTHTGRERSGHTTSGFTDEPRMPPLKEHYTDYVEDVKELKRRKMDAEAETLLLACIDAVEEESRSQGLGVPPWYYEQLAIVRRKRGDVDGEVAILTRYAEMPHGHGGTHEKVMARLEAAKARQG